MYGKGSLDSESELSHLPYLRELFGDGSLEKQLELPYERGGLLPTPRAPKNYAAPIS